MITAMLAKPPPAVKQFLRREWPAASYAALHGLPWEDIGALFGPD
jgi:hypothetical protein